MTMALASSVAMLGYCSGPRSILWAKWVQIRDRLGGGVECNFFWKTVSLSTAGRTIAVIGHTHDVNGYVNSCNVRYEWS